MEHSKKTFYIAFMSGIGVAFGFLYAILGNAADEYTGIVKWIYSNNIKIYLVFLLVFAMVFLMVRGIDKLFFAKVDGLVKRTCRLEGVWQSVGVFSLSMLGVGIFAHWGLVGQFKEIGVANGTYYDFPWLFQAFLMGAVFLWITCIVIRDKDITKETWYVICAVSLLVTFMGLYIVNPFSSVHRTDAFSMGMQDNTSVTETIYNVLDGVPFTYTTSGIYGHYALFFLPFLKLLKICQGGGRHTIWSYGDAGVFRMFSTAGCDLCS